MTSDSIEVTSDSSRTENGTSSGDTSMSKSTGSSSKSTKKVHRSRPGVCKQLQNYFKKMIRSAPEEHTILKSFFAFPIGVLIAIALHFALVERIKLPVETRQVIGGGIGMVISLGFATSTYIRCLILLVVPTFFGKSGRSQIATFALLYLISGPIENILKNSSEITSSLTCVTELLANHSAEKWKLRLHPIKDAMAMIEKDGFMLDKIGKAVEYAFKPIQKEFEKNESPPEGVKKHESSEIKSRHRPRRYDSNAKVTEKKWEEKLDLKCASVFGMAEKNCYDWMGGLMDSCKSAMGILHHLFCLPLRLTVMCTLVRVLPGVIGLDCNSMEVVNPGLGETFLASRNMIDNMDEGLNVNLQYKVVAQEEALDYTSTEEARKRTMHEFNSKRRIMEFVMTLIQRFLAFMFLLIFYKSYQYQNNYLTDFKFDNQYITSYFRHIDFRRRQKGKSTLLPLKKIEKKRVIYPTSKTLMPTERRSFIKGTIKLLFRVILTGIIVIMDYLLYWVLNIISSNSRIDYKQTGVHIVKIHVEGTGFISKIVRMFLISFNSQHSIKHLTTNAGCLPNASQTDRQMIINIFSIYGCVWVFMLFEAYGLRLRRVVCSFFYRKREKRRILYIYNDMLKKRESFLRQMRHRVRKQVKARTLARSVGVFASFLRQFPRCCYCLNICSSSKMTCLICEDAKGPGFYECETEGCNFGYCEDCWIDIKERCYACRQKALDNSDDSDETTSSESSLTDDELSGF